MTIAIRRTLPVLISFYMTLTLAGCATTTATLATEEPARHSVKELDDEHLAGDAAAVQAVALLQHAAGVGVAHGEAQRVRGE